MKHILNKALGVSIILLHSLAVFAQEQPTQTREPIPLLQLSDLEIYPGLNLQPAANAPLNDFKILAPGSPLLNANLNAYSKNYGSGIYTSTAFSATLGMQLRNRQKDGYRKAPQLRAGVAYLTQTLLTGSYYYTRTKPYDTLTSSQTGETTFIDSVYTSSYSMNYATEQLRLDVSMIFRSDPAARWSLFAGVGITAGMSIKAFTEIYNTESRSTITHNGNGSNSSTNNFNIRSQYEITAERYENRPGLGFTGYLPMGIDFRVGKKREFWKPVHLYYEVRPGINITSIPELGSSSGASIQSGMGVRYTFGAASGR